MTDNSGNVNTGSAGFNDRRRALGLSAFKLSQAACISERSVFEVELGESASAAMYRLDAALAVLEVGGSTEDARAAAMMTATIRRGGPHRQLITYEHPPCEQCDGEVLRREGCSISSWKKQRFCSPRCARANIAARPPVKPAPCVDVESTPRADPALPEDCFARHEITPGDGGALHVSRPETHIERGNALGGF